LFCLDDLYTGYHINRNLDEEMQIMWLTFEHDLRECIDSGAVPYSSFESGGKKSIFRFYSKLAND